MLLNKSANILIVRTDRIGDVVLTTPVFKALRQAYPHARITVMVSPTTKDLVDGNPYVNDVMTDDRQGRHKSFTGMLHLARDIRQRGFDVVLIFHTKRRYNLACYLAGVPARVGYQNDKWGWLLTHPHKDTRSLGQKHEVRYCLDVLKTVGIEGVMPELLVPGQKNAEVWANQWFEQEGLTAGEMIAIHPGASDITKIWPAQCFVELINALQQRYAFKIVIIGGKETSVIADGIMRSVKGKVYDLTAKSSVGQMVSILRRCRMLISNDSGPVHVASAVGIHVISLFLRDQPGINPQRWAPFGPRGYTLSSKLHEMVKLDARSRMQTGKLDSITTQEVLDVVERILSGEHQSVFYW